MNHLGGERFAGASRTCQNRGRVAVGCVSDADENALHFRASPAQQGSRFFNRRRQMMTGRAFRGLREQIAHSLFEVMQIQRLYQVADRAQFARRDRILERAVRRDDQCGRTRFQPVHFFQNRQAVHVRQANVEHDEAKLSLGQFLQSSRSGRASLRNGADPRSDGCQRPRQRHFVFNNQQIGITHRAMRTTAPPPERFATASFPPWARTIESATLRPMPMPPSFSE